jgi:hypothetical protein
MAEFDIPARVDQIDNRMSALENRFSSLENNAQSQPANTDIQDLLRRVGALETARDNQVAPTPSSEGGDQVAYLTDLTSYIFGKWFGAEFAQFQSERTPQHVTPIVQAAPVQPISAPAPQPAPVIPAPQPAQQPTQDSATGTPMPSAPSFVVPGGNAGGTSGL